MKDDKLYLEHILDCLNKIDAYTSSGKMAFLQTNLIQDGVVRNLEIIGEATKRLSLEFRGEHPTIPWKQIAGFRDVLIHDYMGVDLDIVWEVIEKDLPKLKKLIIHVIRA